MAVTRSEHLEWSKKRALEYVDAGEIDNAIVSMASDLRKHPELGCDAILVMEAVRFEKPKGAEAVRGWINAFN